MSSLKYGLATQETDPDDVNWDAVLKRSATSTPWESLLGGQLEKFNFKTITYVSDELMRLIPLDRGLKHRRGSALVASSLPVSLGTEAVEAERESFDARSHALEPDEDIHFEQCVFYQC